MLLKVYQTTPQARQSFWTLQNKGAQPVGRGPLLGHGLLQPGHCVHSLTHMNYGCRFSQPHSQWAAGASVYSPTCPLDKTIASSSLLPATPPAPGCQSEKVGECCSRILNCMFIEKRSFLDLAWLDHAHEDLVTPEHKYVYMCICYMVSGLYISHF